MENHLYMLITQWLFHKSVIKIIKKTLHFVLSKLGKGIIMSVVFNALTAYISNIQHVKNTLDRQIRMNLKILHRKKNLKNLKEEYKHENFNFSRRKTKYQLIFLKKAILISGEE